MRYYLCICMCKLGLEILPLAITPYQFLCMRAAVFLKRPRHYVSVNILEVCGLHIHETLAKRVWIAETACVLISMNLWPGALDLALVRALILDSILVMALASVTESISTCKVANGPSTNIPLKLSITAFFQNFLFLGEGKGAGR